MDKVKLVKNVAFGAVFAMLVLASVYFTTAYPSLGNAIFVGNGVGLPNSSVTGFDNINRSNMSGTVTLYLNVSITGTTGIGTNVTNVSFYLITSELLGMNGTLIGVNSSFNKSQPIDGQNYAVSFNTAAFSDANESYAIRTQIGINGTAYENTTIAYNITIDNTAPVITLQGHALDYTGYFQATTYRSNATGVRINVSALDATSELRTCFLQTDFAGTFATNASLISLGNTRNITSGTTHEINITANERYVNLSDGTYLWNVQCNDSLGNALSATANYTLVIDTVVPNEVAVTVPSTSVDFGTRFDLKCSRNDATAAINSTYIKVTAPDSGTLNYYDWNVTTAGASSTATINMASGSDKLFNELGTYKVDCTVRDRAGHEAIAGQKEFQIVSADVGGGGSSGSERTYTWNPETSDSKTQLLKSNDVITFTLKGESHTATVTAVGTNSATVVIASLPVTIELNVGETKKVDIENDNVYDLAVTLKSVIGSKANIDLKVISESYTGESETPGDDIGTEDQEPVTGTSATIWWIVGIIILGIVIAIIYNATKKK